MNNKSPPGGPHLQNPGRTSGGKKHYTEQHGKSRTTRNTERGNAQHGFRTQPKGKVRLSEQSPAKNSDRSISYVIQRDLINRTEFGEISPAQKLMPMPPIIVDHRNQDQKITQSTPDGSNNPSIPTAEYRDDDVSFGIAGAPAPSISTILDDHLSASNLNIAVGADEVRQLVKKHHSSTSENILELRSSSRRRIRGISNTAARRSAGRNSPIKSTRDGNLKKEQPSHSELASAPSKNSDEHHTE